MKRKLIIIISVIIISASTSLSLALLFFAYLSGGFTGIARDRNLAGEINKYKENKLKNTSAFNIKADIDLTRNVVSVNEDITLKTAKSKIYMYVPSANIAETNIKKVSADYGTTQFTKRDTMLEINCSSGQDHISIEYEIELADASKTLSYYGKYSYLTNFLITPGVYNRTGVLIPSYRSSFGDPYIYDINNYYIIFKTDRDVNIYAPGEKEERSFGSNKITIFDAPGLRDFPAVLCRKADVKKIRHGDTDFYFINSSASGEYVKNAFEYAEREIGPYPYKEFFVVKMPLNTLKGMEFSNMIFLSEDCFSNKEELKKVSYHEVFHQWFYGIIGTDQLDEPFLDEGLVNYLSLHLSKSVVGSAYTGEFSGMSLGDYKSREQYYSLAYNDSAAYFCNIHQKLGNNFFKVLQGIYSERKFQIAYFEDFQRHIKRYSDKAQ